MANVQLNPEVLKNIRKHKKLSQVQAAASIGVSERTYKRIETHGRVRVHTRNLICEKFGVDAEVLFGNAPYSDRSSFFAIEVVEYPHCTQDLVQGTRFLAGGFSDTRTAAESKDKVKKADGASVEVFRHYHEAIGWIRDFLVTECSSDDEFEPDCLVQWSSDAKFIYLNIFEIPHRLKAKLKVGFMSYESGSGLNWSSLFKPDTWFYADPMRDMLFDSVDWVSTELMEEFSKLPEIKYNLKVNRLLVGPLETRFNFLDKLFMSVTYSAVQDCLNHLRRVFISCGCDVEFVSETNIAGGRGFLLKLAQAQDHFFIKGAITKVNANNMVEPWRIEAKDHELGCIGNWLS